MTRKRQDAASRGPDTPEGGAPTDGLTDARVAAYLRENPDFLARHGELLDVLQPPARDRGEGVVDLQQFMVERLRQEVARLRESRDDLLHTGRLNASAQSRVHEGALALLAARSFEHLIETATTDLTVILDLDAVTICVEQHADCTARPRIRGVHQLEAGTVDAVLGPRRSHVFLSGIDGHPAIFGPAAGLVQSAALLRLEISSTTPPALLALGSRAPDHFDPSQGGELLLFLARALALTIRQWLELPE